MPIEVRRAVPEEYDEAGRVTALAYREFIRDGDDDWEDYLRHIADVPSRADRTTIVVAVENRRVLGSATLELEGRVDDEEDHRRLEPGESHVRMLGVDPSVRRRGIARMLMEACMEAAREAGKTFMTLNTTQRMKTARAMYETLGFERGEDRVFPDGFVLLSYSRRL